MWEKIFWISWMASERLTKCYSSADWAEGAESVMDLLLELTPIHIIAIREKHLQWKSRGYLIILSGFYAGQMNVAFMLIKA